MYIMLSYWVYLIYKDISGEYDIENKRDKKKKYNKFRLDLSYIFYS